MVEVNFIDREKWTEFKQLQIGDCYRDLEYEGLNVKTGAHRAIEFCVETGKFAPAKRVNERRKVIRLDVIRMDYCDAAATNDGDDDEEDTE